MKVHSQTDVGLVRTLNEDACSTGLLGENGAWAVVCDGMGGANGGEVASGIAVKSIEQQILSAYEEDFKHEEMKLMLSTLIFHANSAVYDMAQENESLRGMGTTVVVAIVLDNVAHIAHAGDSRAYLLHNGSIMQLTTDHSMVQELIKNGDLTVEQAKVHPQKNIITRALGVNPVVEIDYEEVKLAEGDRILICTDGLTNYIEAVEIRELAEKLDSVSLTDKLVAIAKENGGGDNITVAILDN